MTGARGLQRKRLARYLDLPKTGKGPEEKKKTSISSRTYISEGVTGQYHNDSAARKFSSKLLQ